MSRLKVDRDDIEEYIRDYVKYIGFSPSVRDLSLQFDVSTSTIHRHLLALIAEGRLTRRQGIARTWRLAE